VFYTWQTVHAAARKSRKVYDLLNRNAAFWVLALGSVQANSLIALGRIFDKDNRTHNVSRLLKLAEANPAIFSKAAVRRRKNKDLANASHLVDDFMSNVKEPRTLDFKRLRSFADARRKVYERATNSSGTRFTHTRIGRRSVALLRRRTRWSLGG